MQDLNLRPLDPQSWAAGSPPLANDRILSATNDLDAGERSRTSAKSAPWLHNWLHELSTVLRHRSSQRGGRLSRCGSGRPQDLSCVRKIAQVGRYAFGEFRFVFLIQHHAVPMEASARQSQVNFCAIAQVSPPGLVLRGAPGRTQTGFHLGRNGRVAGSCPRLQAVITQRFDMAPGATRATPALRADSAATPPRAGRREQPDHARGEFSCIRKS
jgi:hypothetical protein